MIKTLIAAAVIVLILFLAIRYLVNEKRKGVQCVGCPYASQCATQGSCSSHASAEGGSSCGCNH